MSKEAPAKDPPASYVEDNDDTFSAGKTGPPASGPAPRTLNLGRGASRWSGGVAEGP